MKRISSPSGHLHISIVTFAETALGRSREENIARFTQWFRDIAAASPEILQYQIVQGDRNAECDHNVCFTVLYRTAEGLEDIRALPQHQQMLAWFEQVSGSRLSVDRRLRDDNPPAA